MSLYSSPYICQTCLGYMNLGSLHTASCKDHCVSCTIANALSDTIDAEHEALSNDRRLAAAAREALSNCIGRLIHLFPTNNALDDLIQTHIKHLRNMRNSL